MKMSMSVSRYCGIFTRKFIYFVGVVIIVLLVFIWVDGGLNAYDVGHTGLQEHTSPSLEGAALAKRLQAAELMARPLLNGGNISPRMPRYIHQSWKDSELDENMSRWSSICRAVHADWEWILWTDQDNLAMTRKYFPWFVSAYLALPEEINRADVARNMYMYLFGGVYADLDTECVRDVSALFKLHEVVMADDQLDVARANAAHADGGSDSASRSNIPTAFLGRMDYDSTDNSGSHTIPNAWMASTPGHPFWLFVLHNLRAQIQSTLAEELRWLQIEDITGPMALNRDLRLYETLVDKGVSVDNIFGHDSSWHLFDRDFTVGKVSKIELLPPKTIYPFPWNNAGRWFRGICQPWGKTFDSRRCKASVITDETYAITYWTNSWVKD